MSLGIQTKTLSLPKALVYTWGDGGNKAQKKKKFSSYGADLLVEAAEMNQAKLKTEYIRTTAEYISKEAE